MYASMVGVNNEMNSQVLKFYYIMEIMEQIPASFLAVHSTLQPST